MALPKDILARSERVYSYHRGSKYLFGGSQIPPAVETLQRPVWAPMFPDLPPISLPMDLLDVAAGTLSLMQSSVEALPAQFVRPPQNLRTLASWLYLADGVLDAEAGLPQRTWSSEASTYPTQLYVAVFDLQDIEPGLYHYCPAEFALRQLRDGPQTLSHILRGRPDLRFLKNAPAALLVSTAFARAAWRFGSRAYRTALIDAGQLTQNLVTCASGLGIQTMTRLRMTDSTMRELIGLSARAPFHEAEAVQSMVVWADRVHRQVEAANGTGAAVETALQSNVDLPVASLNSSPPNSPTAAPDDTIDLEEADLEIDEEQATDSNELTDTPVDASLVNTQPVDTSPAPAPPPRKALNHGALSFSSVLTPELVLPRNKGSALPAIARGPQMGDVLAYGSVTAVHQDCVAAGIAVRQIRPPVTEVSPLPADATLRHFPKVKATSAGEPLRKTTRGYREPAVFSRQLLPRDIFRRIVRCSLAAGTFFPLFPEGPHMGLVRPLWIINAVNGFDCGLWYYNASIDGWTMLRPGSFRFHAQFMALDDGRFGSAAAVCVLAAGMPSILGLGGPDTYRLALLETGNAAHRMRLAAAALGAATISTASFYDDELRTLFGLQTTGWEPLALIAVGIPE